MLAFQDCWWGVNANMHDDKYPGWCLVGNKFVHLPLLHDLAVFLVPRPGLLSNSA